MKILLIVLACLVGPILVLALIGACLPRNHHATRTAVFHRSPADVYAVIADFAAMPSWRTGLAGVEILPPSDGRASFREITPHRPITYVVLEAVAPARLVTQIADEHLPFGGRWTYEISPDPAGCQLRITEEGEVKNVIFRCLARFVFGYTGTMETYLRDLGKKFGEIVSPGS